MWAGEGGRDQATWATRAVVRRSGLILVKWEAIKSR